MKRPFWFGPRPDFGLEPRSWPGLVVVLLAAALLFFIFKDTGLTAHDKWVWGGGIVGLLMLIVALTYRHERP